MLHSHPVPACCGCAITNNVTPSGPVNECDAQTSSNDRVNPTPSGVRAIKSRGNVGTLLNNDESIPKVNAKFGFESPSIAKTR
jgi:hypothetical protein